MCSGVQTFFKSVDQVNERNIELTLLPVDQGEISDESRVFDIGTIGEKEQNGRYVGSESTMKIFTQINALQEHELEIGTLGDIVS